MKHCATNTGASSGVMSAVSKWLPALLVAFSLAGIVPVVLAAWRGLSFVNGEFWITGRNGGGRRSSDGANWEDLPAETPAGRFVQSPGGTIINVARGRYDIKRSTDGRSWETVFTAPEGKSEEKDVTWDTAFAVYGKVNKVAK